MRGKLELIAISFLLLAGCSVNNNSNMKDTKSIEEVKEDREDKGISSIDARKLELLRIINGSRDYYSWNEQKAACEELYGENYTWRVDRKTDRGGCTLK